MWIFSRVLNVKKQAYVMFLFIVFLALCGVSSGKYSDGSYTPNW